MMSEQAEIRSGVSVMREASLRDELVSVAGPRAWGDTRESWLNRAARTCGITFRQAKSIFYGETRDPRASVERAIREAARLKREKQARQADAAKLLNLAAALDKRDEQFFISDVEAMRSLADRLLALDRK